MSWDTPNGNAVKIRGGRAAVSVCSDSYIGNPRGIFIHCPAIRKRKTEILTSELCPLTSELLPDGKELRGKTQVRKPACNWLYICKGPILSFEARARCPRHDSKWEPLCSRELEHKCGSTAFLRRPEFFCAGRLNRRFSRGNGGFFIGTPSRLGPNRLGRR